MYIEAIPRKQKNNNFGKTLLKHPVCVEPARSKAASIHPSVNLSARVARFFLTQYTKTGKTDQIAAKLPNGNKMFQMAVVYYKRPKNITNLLHSEALQNLPKLVFLVRKNTIWQPCYRLHER
jgi:hypothetical protein